MSDQHDRPVVAGDEPDGPIRPGAAGAPPDAAADTAVGGGAEAGAPHARPDAGRMAGEDALTRAPNQARTEPIPPTPPHDAPTVESAGSAGTAGSAGGGRPDDDAGTATSPGPREGWATPPPSSAPTGDVHGANVPGTTPAEGTSEGMAPVEGVTFPAIAPEGLADGETDVAMPSTTSF